MARKIRLTESELVQLIKKSLNEQQDADWWKKLKTTISQTKANERKKSLEDAWCSVKNGVVTKFLPEQIQWCGPNGYMERMNITSVEWVDLEEKCPNIISNPPSDIKQGFNEIYQYYKNAQKIVTEISQPMCNDYSYFQIPNSNGTNITIYHDGETEYYPKAGSRILKGTWEWDGTKPVLKGLLTRKAVGYAETQEDITNNKKILYIGSKNDLVKRVQFEILFWSKGKTNVGCKKDTDGKYKPLLCDGIFGPKTKKGVQDYQRAEGLRDKSGIVGAETWGSMRPIGIDADGLTEEQLKSE